MERPLQRRGAATAAPRVEPKTEPLSPTTPGLRDEAAHPTRRDAAPGAGFRLAGTAALDGIDEQHPAMRLLREACHLAAELETERTRLLGRLAAAGRQDPLRLVTGATSLDRACQEAEQMVRMLDELLAVEAESQLAGPHANGAGRA